MTHKHVLFRTEAREKVLRGATTLTDAVRITLGPKLAGVVLLAEATLTEIPEPEHRGHAPDEG